MVLKYFQLICKCELEEKLQKRKTDKGTWFVALDFCFGEWDKLKKMERMHPLFANATEKESAENDWIAL